jgi:hypothetical protein
LRTEGAVIVEVAGPHKETQIKTDPAVRKLKIEETGDYWKKQLKPKIRLTGHWLERAGFKPGSHVWVRCVAPGVLELRSR